MSTEDKDKEVKKILEDQHKTFAPSSHKPHTEEEQAILDEHKKLPKDLKKYDRILAPWTHLAKKVNQLLGRAEKETPEKPTQKPPIKPK